MTQTELQNILTEDMPKIGTMVTEETPEGTKEKEFVPRRLPKIDIIAVVFPDEVIDQYSSTFPYVEAIKAGTNGILKIPNYTVLKVNRDKSGATSYKYWDDKEVIKHGKKVKEYVDLYPLKYFDVISNIQNYMEVQNEEI